MGYNTRYTIERTAGGDHAKFMARLDDEPSCMSEECLSGAVLRKWYEHDVDIANAMRFSGVKQVDLFGEGDEHGDVWDKEYRETDGVITVTEWRYELVRGDKPAGTKTL